MPNISSPPLTSKNLISGTTLTQINNTLKATTTTSTVASTTTIFTVPQPAPPTTTVFTVPQGVVVASGLKQHALTSIGGMFSSELSL